MTERYDGLDGLRTIACLGIIAMHIKANAAYQIPIELNNIVASFTHFVPLFLIISGFGMFCGYYAKFRNNNIDLNSFYTRRYKKILPFFVTLILIDIVITRSIDHIIEGIMEATMVFGLLPNNELDVIGVSWTLGVIFLFYMLFPFIVYLCWTKKRAWITFLVSILLSIFCSYYFFSDKFVIEEFTPRHNILYCAPWIIGGGLVYLYRESIKSYIAKHRYGWLFGCICLVTSYYWGTWGVPSNIVNLLLFLPWIMYAISVGSKVLSNRAMKYLSNISLELYLAQMVIFRGVEKAHGLYILGHGIVGFITTWVVIVIGLIIFIEIWKRGSDLLSFQFFQHLGSAR